MISAQQEIARNYLALSREFQEQHYYRKAEQTLLLALDKYPNEPSLLSRLSNLYLKLDMPEKALGTLQQLISFNPGMTYPFLMRGQIHEGNGDLAQAAEDYELSLTGSRKDYATICRLLPVMIELGMHETVLATIQKYQEMFSDPTMFAEYESETLLNMDQYPAAFGKLREAVMRDPANVERTKRYLRFSIRSGKKSPTQVYDFLRLSTPGIAELTTAELVEIEISHHIYQRDFEKALSLTEELLEYSPEHYDWRKQRAIIMLEMGEVEESASEFRQLFVKDSTDIEVRNILENYYIVKDNIDDWKVLLHRVLSSHPEQLDLFNYLRSMSPSRDWLAMCKLDYESFMKAVQQVNLVRSELDDNTFEKLPAYALEAFIAQLAIHNRIPDPHELVEAIYRNRSNIGRVAPFQVEDIEAAYPVWVFSLHIYFLFRSCSEFEAAFEPRMLQSERVPAMLDTPDGPALVKISALIGNNNQRQAPQLENDNIKQLDWGDCTVRPDLMYHELQFYSPDAFEDALMELGVL